jgi:hypothetical protein
VDIAPAVAIDPALGVDEEPPLPAVDVAPVPACDIPVGAVVTPDPDVPAVSVVLGLIVIESPEVGCMPPPDDGELSSPPQAATTQDANTKRANCNEHSWRNILTSHARESQFL